MMDYTSRYAPGSRVHSFFVGMPLVNPEWRNRSSDSASNTHLFEYTYYIDSDGTLVKEKLE